MPDLPKQYPSDFFKGGSLAYLIGMNAYRFVPPLDSPKNDCLGLEQVLQQQHGFKITTLFDATRQAVIDLLDQIKQDCKADSRVIFYYAGHGIADGADDDTQRPKGFLLAVDSERGKEDTYVEMGHVLEVLVGLPCSHLLIILDCCYAGAIRYAEQTRSIGSSVPKTLYAEKFTYYIGNPARQVITSAACDQKAMDALGSRGRLNANHRSPFAESLIQNLAQGDKDWSFGHIQPDGIVTASELGYFLSMEVSDQLSKNNVPFAEQQTPSVFRIGDRTKGEFIFVSSQKAILQLQPNPKENPWKGLADYSITDNHLFYGRQRVLDGWWEGKTQYKGLVQLVSPEENIHKILVTGRSGSGKSSLVKAGVLARLDDGTPGSVTIITPGSTPMAAHGQLLEELKAKPGKVYLMVDQHEELVTVCNDPAEKEAFEKALVEITKKPDAIVIITLRSDLERRFVNSPLIDENIFRFVVPPFSREEIREVVLQPAIQQLLEFRGTYTGDHVDGDSAKSQDQADERFVNRIIDETFANPDSLPLLSFALNRLYEMKDPDPAKPLLEADYDDFGGISGILDKKLTDAYDAYDAEHQALFRQLIYRMISFDAGYMAKRRVYTTFVSTGRTINELEFSDPATTAGINAVQQELVNQRLLKSSRENEAGGTGDDNVYFEPAHEALLRSSNLISQWQNEAGGAFQGRIILLNAVSASAKNYYFFEGKGKKGSLWKDDPRLSLVKRMWDTKELYLNSVEETFLVDSLKARSIAKKVSRAVVLFIFSIIIAAGIFFFLENNKLQDQLALSYWNSSLAAGQENDPLKSLLFLAKAVTTNRNGKMNDLMQSQVSHFFPSALLTGVLNNGSNINSFILSKDEKLLLTLSDSMAVVWDLGKKQKLFSVNKPLINGHLSPDGRKLFLVNDIGVESWDIFNKKKISQFFTGNNAKIAWNPVVSKFLVNQADNKIYLLDSDFKKTPWLLYGKFAVLCANGKRLTAMSVPSSPGHYSDSVNVWSLEGDAPKVVYKAKDNDAPHYSKLSPGGKYLALIGAVSGPGVLYVINTATGQQFTTSYRYAAKLAEFDAAEDKLFFADDVADLLVIDLNTYKAINLWDPKFDTDQPLGYNFDAVHFFPAQSKQYKDSLLIDKDEGSGVWNIRTRKLGSAFNFDDAYAERSLLDWDTKNIFTYSGNGHLRVNDLNGRSKGLSFFTAPAARPQNLQLSASKKRFFAAAGSRIYTYDLFDAQGPAEATDLDVACFSKDGQFSLTLDKKNILRLFNHNPGDDQKAKKMVAISLIKVLKSDTDRLRLRNISFSRDGRLALAQIADTSLYLLDFEKGSIQLLCKYISADFEGGFEDGTEGLVIPAGFVEKDHSCIFCDERGYIHLFNLVGGKQSVITRLPEQYRSNVRFNEDGTYLVAGSQYPTPTVSEFNLSESPSAKPGRIGAQAIHIPEGEKNYPPVFEQYIGNDRFMMVFSKRILVYNLKQGKEENIFDNFKPVKSINKVFLSNDNNRLMVVFDGNKLGLFDLVSGTMTASFPVAELGGRSKYALALNNDNNQLVVLTDKTINFIDISTGKGTIKKYQESNGREYDPHAVFNGYTLYYFDGSSVKTLGSDIDLPADLFQKQAIALTGSQVNPASSEPESVPADELQKLRDEYEKEAAAHYKVCKYKQFNLWKQLHPGDGN